MSRTTYVVAAIVGLGVGVFVGSAVLVRMISRDHAGASPTASVAPAASIVPAPLPSAHFAIVSFKGSEGADECADLDIVGAAATKADAPKPRKNEQAIEQRCDDAFGDRVTLATCTITKKGDGGVLTIVSHYYDALAGLDDDRDFRGCLKEGGEWWTIGRDSDEYKRSRLRGHAHQLQKLGEQLQKGPQ